MVKTLPEKKWTSVDDEWGAEWKWENKEQVNFKEWITNEPNDSLYNKNGDHNNELPPDSQVLKRCHYLNKLLWRNGLGSLMSTLINRQRKVELFRLFLTIYVFFTFVFVSWINKMKWNKQSSMWVDKGEEFALSWRCRICSINNKSCLISWF
jgi:hypothetical protein